MAAPDGKQHVKTGNAGKLSVSRPSLSQMTDGGRRNVSRLCHTLPWETAVSGDRRLWSEAS